MTVPIDDTEQVFRDLEYAGLLKRWWCARCRDNVPYRCLEMTEEQSRLAHNKARHPRESA